MCVVFCVTWVQTVFENVLTVSHDQSTCTYHCNLVYDTTHTHTRTYRESYAEILVHGWAYSNVTVTAIRIHTADSHRSKSNVIDSYG